MSRHDVRVSLAQMLEHAREAVAMIEGCDRSDLDTDRKLNLALVRLLEIVGEAANRVPGPEQVRLAGLPWPQIVSLRNRLIHGYDSVNFDILWRIVTYDLPGLIRSLEAILESSTPDDRQAAQ